MGKITKKSFVTVSGEMQPYEYTRTIKLFDKKILKTCVFYKRKIWSLKMTSIYSIKKCVEKLVSDFIFLFAGALSWQELSTCSSPVRGESWTETSSGQIGSFFMTRFMRKQLKFSKQ